MKITATFLSMLAVAICMTACSDNLQSSNWKSSSADFSKYKTYAWAAPGDTTLTTERNDKLFAGTIYLFANDELSKKGMKRVTSKPDAVFMFDTQVEDRTRYSQSPSLSVGFGVGGGYGYGGPGYYVGGMVPVAGGQITAVPYREGRLIYEMFDARSGELVWRGWAEKTVNTGTDISDAIRYATRSIIYKLPVRVKKEKK